MLTLIIENCRLSPRSSMDLEQSRPKGKIEGSSPSGDTRARGIAVTRVHGMDESGVRFPAGPQHLARCQSGLMGRFRKPLYLKEYRRFESSPRRICSTSKKTKKSQKI